jgi:hypothetical protein
MQPCTFSAPALPHPHKPRDLPHPSTGGSRAHVDSKKGSTAAHWGRGAFGACSVLSSAVHINVSSSQLSRNVSSSQLSRNVSSSQAAVIAISPAPDPAAAPALQRACIRVHGSWPLATVATAHHCKSSVVEYQLCTLVQCGHRAQSGHTASQCMAAGLLGRWAKPQLAHNLPTLYNWLGTQLFSTETQLLSTETQLLSTETQLLSTETLCREYLEADEQKGMCGGSLLQTLKRPCSNPETTLLKPPYAYRDLLLYSSRGYGGWSEGNRVPTLL